MGLIRRHPYVVWTACASVIFAVVWMLFCVWKTTPQFPGSDAYLSPQNTLFCIVSIYAPIQSAFGARCIAAANRYGLADSLVDHAHVLWSAAGLVAVMLFVAFLIARWTEPQHTVVRGRRLLGLDDFRRAARIEARQFGRGLEIMRGLYLSTDRCVRHFLTIGSTGGGKTQTILRLAVPAVRRGDRFLGVDQKGDLTSGLADRNGRPPLLIAPHDRRSAVWDVAVDLDSVELIEEFAQRLYPPPAGENPMWSLGAAAILTTYMMACFHTHGKSWGWIDLYEYTRLDLEQSIALAREHYPEALRYIDSAEETSKGFDANFASQVRIIRVLAKAWSGSQRPKFSVRQWMLDDTPRHQVVILQRSTRYPTISNAWVSAMLDAAGATVGDPALSESKTRRIWMVVDEFAQLPKMKNFSALLDLGRSKGISVLLGTQDLSQISEAYGQYIASSWLTSIGTKFITRINAGPSAQEVSELVGEQDIEVEQETVTVSDNGRSTSISKTIVPRRVITPSELVSKLSPYGRRGKTKGVNVLILDHGEDAYIVKFPLIKLPNLRPASVPAAWTEGITEENLYSRRAVEIATPQDLTAEILSDATNLEI